MPHHNRFRHQEYSADPPRAPYELLQPAPPLPQDSPLFTESLRQLGIQLWSIGVRKILLLHGSFLGADLTGLIGQIERAAPQWAESLRAWEKSTVDALVGDLANYTQEFAERLAQGINVGLEQNQIQVRRFTWSSANNHLGRADGAVRLLSEMLDWLPGPQDRLLVFGHSHGGNVLAIMTHLLGGSPQVRRDFFQAARSYYQRPVRRTIDLPIWKALADRLEEASPAWRPDIVTFGTPIRYGWETSGYRSLLHIVHHRPQAGKPEYLAPFPPTLEQITHGTAGDFIHQIGVAGTNFPVNILSCRDWLAESRLQRLLQRGQHRRHTWERQKLGMRVAEEGKTLLVDYHAGDVASSQLLAGHAVYTKLVWLPFHLQQIVKYLSTVSGESS